MIKRLLKGGLLACAGLLSVFFTYVPPAGATLTITPTLVVIQGRDRYGDVSLVNSDDKPMTYDISWNYSKMEEGTGLYKNVETSLTEFDLPKHLVISPRRVTLPPNGVQRIRLGLRLNGEPPAPGDYRAHLLMQGANQQKAPETKGTEKDPSQPSKAKVGVSINVGFSIPIIYRVGESTDVIEIGAVKTQVTDKGKIEAVIPITKTKSTFGSLGSLMIYHNDQVVGQVRNANIFPEISSRTFKVGLTTDKLVGGSLKIVYENFDNKNKQILAEKTVPIGQ